MPDNTSCVPSGAHRSAPERELIPVFFPVLNSSLPTPCLAPRERRSDAFGAAPLIAYLNCDARHAKYSQNLASILQRFPKCAITDNIELQRALARPQAEERVLELEKLRKRFPDGDTSAEVLFRLGTALTAAGERDEARKRFEELIDGHAGSRFVTHARHAMLVGGMGPAQAAGG